MGSALGPVATAPKTTCPLRVLACPPAMQPPTSGFRPRPATAPSSASRRRKRRLKAPASPSSPWTLPCTTLVTCGRPAPVQARRSRADRVPCGAGSSDSGQAEAGDAVRQGVDPSSEPILGTRPFGSEDELTEFDSGEPGLDDWLRKRAEPTWRPAPPAACSRAATGTWSGTTHWPLAASSGLEAIWRIGQGCPNRSQWPARAAGP
jgi:hypothetical protein